MEIRNSITREEVFQAASELFAQGMNPTQVKVREKLGRGSYSTINKHLQEWKKVGKDVEIANLATNPMEPVPDDIRKEAFLQFDKLLSEIHTKATNKAEENKVNAMVTTLETENRELRDKLVGYEEMKGRTGVLEEQVKWLSAENAKLSEQIGQLKQSVEHMQENLQPTSQSKNGHVIELSSRHWEHDVNPSDD